MQDPRDRGDHLLGRVRPALPLEAAVVSRLRGEDDAARVWELSEHLTGVSFPAALSRS